MARMHALFLALTLAAQTAPALVGPDAADAVPRTYAWPGTSVGPRFTDGGVGMVEIGLSYRLVDWLEPEAVVGIGAHAVLPDGARLQVIDRFSFGTRVVAPLDGMRPFLWLALHHEHQGEWAAVLANPIGSTLGISTDGVAHYTGVEAGLGTALQFDVDDNPLQAMVRVNVVYLPALGGHVGHAAMTDQLALLVDVAGGCPCGSEGVRAERELSAVDRARRRYVRA